MRVNANFYQRQQLSISFDLSLGRVGRQLRSVDVAVERREIYSISHTNTRDRDDDEGSVNVGEVR